MVEQRVRNLHDIVIPDWCHYGDMVNRDQPLDLPLPTGHWRAGMEDVEGLDLSDYPKLKELAVFFTNLETVLLLRIGKCDAVFGCVAWLISERILEALAKKKAVALIVQKEDFLRPDLGAKSDWKRNLRTLYDALPAPPDRYSDTWNTLRFYETSRSHPPNFEPVRCVGIAPGNGATKPNMHHKFVLFADLVDNPDHDHEGICGEECEPQVYYPHTVWTESYNFTENSNCSFENAVIIQERDIVDAYFQAFGELMAISEPLDWGSRRVAPEWGIGS